MKIIDFEINKLKQRVEFMMIYQKILRTKFSLKIGCVLCLYI